MSSPTRVFWGLSSAPLLVHTLLQFPLDMLCVPLCVSAEDTGDGPQQVVRPQEPRLGLL